MKRIRVSSLTNQKKCYLAFPSIKPNEKYRLYVEKLFVSGGTSHVFEGELFTIRRRMLADTERVATDHYASLVYGTFAATNIQNATQLVGAIDDFLKTFMKRNRVRDWGGYRGFEVHNDYYAVPAGLANPPTTDWFGIDPGYVLRCCIHTDGRIGFLFGEDALQMFVIELTELGQRVFGHSTRFIAPNQVQGFDTYEQTLDTTANPSEIVSNDVDAPAVGAEAIKWMGQSSLFSHVKYRQEIILNTDLPTPGKWRITDKSSYLSKELASYEIPAADTKLRYLHPDIRRLSERAYDQYVFETSTNTNSDMLLTGTDLQNFTVRLEERVFERDGAKYKEIIRPYAMAEGGYFIVQFAIEPLK